MVSVETVEPEEADVVPRRSVEGEVGEDLPDHGAELEAVAGEAGRDDRMLALRMAVDQEVLVGRRLEETSLERDGRAGAVREVALGELSSGASSASVGSRSIDSGAPPSP